MSRAARRLADAVDAVITGKPKPAHVDCLWRAVRHPNAAPGAPVVMRGMFRYVRHVTDSGRVFRVYTAFRADARGGKGYEVSMASVVNGVWMVWESIEIDGPVRTMREVRELVALYVASKENNRPVTYLHALRADGVLVIT